MTQYTNLQVRFEIANPGELPNPPNTLPRGWPRLVRLKSVPGVLLRGLRERATAPLRLPELDRILAACVPDVDPGDSVAAEGGIDRPAEAVTTIDSYPECPGLDANGPWSASFGPYGFRIAARPGRRPWLTCRPRGNAARHGRTLVNA